MSRGLSSQFWLLITNILDHTYVLKHVKTIQINHITIDIYVYIINIYIVIVYTNTTHYVTIHNPIHHSLMGSITIHIQLGSNGFTPQSNYPYSSVIIVIPSSTIEVSKKMRMFYILFHRQKIIWNSSSSLSWTFLSFGGVYYTHYPLVI